MPPELLSRVIERVGGIKKARVLFRDLHAKAAYTTDNRGQISIKIVRDLAELFPDIFPEAVADERTIRSWYAKLGIARTGNVEVDRAEKTKRLILSSNKRKRIQSSSLLPRFRIQPPTRSS